MGDPWLTTHEQYRDFDAALYLRKSWERLLAPLSQKGLTSLSGEQLDERLKSFNEDFDESHKKQSNWIS
nr:exocyst complex component exo70a1 [Quercus suber]